MFGKEKNDRNKNDSYKYVCSKCKNVWHDSHPKGSSGMGTREKCDRCGTMTHGINKG